MRRMGRGRDGGHAYPAAAMHSRARRRATSSFVKARASAAESSPLRAVMLVAAALQEPSAGVAREARDWSAAGVGRMPRVAAREDAASRRARSDLDIRRRTAAATADHLRGQQHAERCG